MIKDMLDEHIRTIEGLYQLKDKIQDIADLILKTYKKDGKVVLFGNGGSAADAQHIACELVGKFEKKRKALPAIALTTNTSILTSIANDFSYDEVFERQIEALINKDDVAIGISTSGKSVNVLKGLKIAKSKGAKTVVLCGKNKTELNRVANISLNVPSTSTPRIQEAHITIGHIICKLVECKTK